jgi:hypothetical protein
VLLVTRLDRLARSTRDLLNLLDEISARGRVVAEAIAKRLMLPVSNDPAARRTTAGMYSGASVERYRH